jgi:hypothetical protein
VASRQVSAMLSRSRAGAPVLMPSGGFRASSKVQLRSSLRFIPDAFNAAPFTMTSIQSNNSSQDSRHSACELWTAITSGRFLRENEKLIPEIRDTPDLIEECSSECIGPKTKRQFLVRPLIPSIGPRPTRRFCLSSRGGRCGWKA